MIDWIWVNKEWLFSGIDVVLVVGVVSLLRRWAQARTIEPRHACDSGTLEQQGKPSAQHFDRALLERARASFPEFLEIYKTLQDRFYEQAEGMGSDITMTTILTLRAILDTSHGMARRPRVFVPGLLYHVIVRGNQRRKTFRCDDDYKAYLDRLEHYRAKF